MKAVKSMTVTADPWKGAGARNSGSCLAQSRGARTNNGVLFPPLGERRLSNQLRLGMYFQ
jgi:hypothetical protein